MTRRITLFALILLATALRFYRLAAQDIWGDEAFSIFLSQQPVAFVIAGGSDTHPPLYPFLLWTWLPLVGAHAFATRALSALIGILATPLIFVTAQRMTRSTRVAFLSALFTTISPLLIYYAQETRMYEQVAILSLASTYFCLRWDRAFTRFPANGQPAKASNPIIAFGFFITTLAAMYTHYAAFFVWVAQNIFIAIRFLLSFRASARNPGFRARDFSRALEMTELKRWAILQIALLVAYVPWIIVQTSFLRGKASARFDEWSLRGIEMIFGKTFLAFSAGVTTDFPIAQMIALAFLVFAALGIVIAARDERAGFAPFYFLAPVVIAFALNPIMPFFFERYVLVALPGFYLCVALGLDFLARRAPLSAFALTGALVIASTYALFNFYFDDAYAKGKYGQMMAHIAAHAQAGDAIILNNPLQKPLYRYYAPRDLPAFFLPDGAPLEDQATRAQLDQIARDHSRIWLVVFGNPLEYDPTGYLERFFGARAFKSFARGFVDAGLTLYEMPGAQSAIRHDLRATLGEQIQLTGYALNRDSFAPGETILLTLHWQTRAPIPNRYKVFTHLIGAFNPATNSPIWAQMDGEPVGGSRATTAWQIGETIADRYGLQIPNAIPPGEYQIEIGMYDPITGARVPVFDANRQRVADDRVIVQTIHIRAR
ncbi:MAG: glycosyltransferase family 39 protein [Chloroflexi bacterium]|nr:glycosyltransferase family 39 protein [Chloroflexota bacterium]